MIHSCFSFQAEGRERGDLPEGREGSDGEGPGRHGRGGGGREAQELAAVSSSQKREEVEWLYIKILINT
jgi:hypothetical protein